MTQISGGPVQIWSEGAGSSLGLPSLTSLSAWQSSISLFAGERLSSRQVPSRCRKK